MIMNELKIKGASDVNEACEVLENLVEGLKDGTVCIQLGKRSLTLKPTERIYLKIQATQKGEIEKLQIKMSWPKMIRASQESSTFKPVPHE
jgi:amphi-Trp domain-containing protein